MWKWCEIMKENNENNVIMKIIIMKMKEMNNNIMKMKMKII